MAFADFLRGAALAFAPLAGVAIPSAALAAPAQTRPVYVVPAAAKNTGAIAARIPSGPSMTIYRGVADTQYEVPHYGLR